MTTIRNRLAQAIYQAIIESDAVDPAQSAYMDAADAVLDELTEETWRDESAMPAWGYQGQEGLARNVRRWVSEWEGVEE